MQQTFANVLKGLQATDPAELAALYQAADSLRHRHVGDGVHLRGLVEISNTCCRRCCYCGLRAPNSKVTRYRLSLEQLLDCAQRISDCGWGTIVLQAGEDPYLTADRVAEIVSAIKSRTRLAVTLSLGEKSFRELKLWREAGADRYLLRFETSDPDLFHAIHPPLLKGSAAGSGPRIENDNNVENNVKNNVEKNFEKSFKKNIERIIERNNKKEQQEVDLEELMQRNPRFAVLKSLRDLGYEVGSGVMIGLPGQTYSSLARDLALFQKLELDMVGVGPFLPHPDTPLGQMKPVAAPMQVPASVEMVCKTIALTRMLLPLANIPATTALATLSPESGRMLGLQRGANVIMPNFTPQAARQLYSIYPNKACPNESAESVGRELEEQLAACGRHISYQRGDSANYRRRLQSS